MGIWYWDKEFLFLMTCFHFQRKVNVEIDLPPLLREELEKDFIAINRQNMVSDLSAA